MEQIFNDLVEFKDKQVLTSFLLNLNKEEALKLIEMALQMGCKSGIYTIEENYVIYVALKKLRENENIESGGVSNDNSDGNYD